MGKLTVLAAAGAGYVLGTRAGRERYDQIVAAASKVRRDPRVQAQAQRAADTVREHGPAVVDAVKEKARDAAAEATSRRNHDHSGAPQGQG